MVHGLSYQSFPTSESGISGRSSCTSPEWTVSLIFFCHLISFVCADIFCSLGCLYTAQHWCGSYGLQNTWAGLVQSWQWSRRSSLETEPIKLYHVWAGTVVFFQHIDRSGPSYMFVLHCTSLDLFLLASAFIYLSNNNIKLCTHSHLQLQIKKSPNPLLSCVDIYSWTWNISYQKQKEATFFSIFICFVLLLACDLIMAISVFISNNWASWKEKIKV